MANHLNSEMGHRIADVNACAEYMASAVEQIENEMRKLRCLGSYYRLDLKELSEKYDEINPIQMAAISEDIIRILAEIEAGHEAVNYVRGFIYFTVNFESVGKARSKKLLLGDIFDGEKNLYYDEKQIVRSFKAYMYSLRSDAVPSAPTGWSLDQEKGIDFLKEIAEKEFSIFDAVQS